MPVLVDTSVWVNYFRGKRDNAVKLPARGELMASEPYTRTGTLSNPRTVVLDSPLTLPLGRVRVVVEALSVPAVEHSWLEKLEENRSEHRGHQQGEVAGQREKTGRGRPKEQHHDPPVRSCDHPARHCENREERPIIDRGQ